MRKKFAHSVTPENVYVVENPLSGKILVVSWQDDIRDAVKIAAEYLNDPNYKARAIEISCDFGQTVFTLKPKDRTSGMTAVDLYTGLWQSRFREAPTSYMFDRTAEGQGGIIHASFGKHTEHEKIYGVAMDAALLSRENGGKPVEFDFRGKKVVVSGSTPPEDIEKMFPESQRMRKDPPPLPKFAGYKPY